MQTIIKGSGGPTYVSSGGVSQDKYGLSTSTARWWALYEANLNPVAVLGTIHPTYSSLRCERRLVSDTGGGGFFLDAYFAGIVGTPTPVYEIDTVTIQAPIETHPNFASFAGTIGTPLNGAIFDPTDGTFRKFGNDAPDRWRGVTSYEMPVAIVRETEITVTSPSVATVGRIDSPPLAPSLGAGQTWRLASVTSDIRGRIYVVRREWQASGPKGWNTVLYA